MRRILFAIVALTTLTGSAYGTFNRMVCRQNGKDVTGLVRTDPKHCYISNEGECFDTFVIGVSFGGSTVNLGLQGDCVVSSKDPKEIYCNDGEGLCPACSHIFSVEESGGKKFIRVIHTYEMGHLRWERTFPYEACETN